MAGSHGSLAKAGKVRNQTPKVQGKPRKPTMPRTRNRMNYLKRVLAPPDTNQRSFGGRRRRR